MLKFCLCWRPAMASLTLAIGTLLGCSAGIAEDFKKEYWATSLAGAVDEGILQGLYDAVDRGEIGWLDIDPKYSIHPLKPGINLIFYHVGGNCYIASDFLLPGQPKTDGATASV